MKNAPRTVLVLSFFFSFSCALSAQELQFASLGDFKLKSGEVIHDCRVGYRTFGHLHADRSNAILMPTWAGGTTEELKSWSYLISDGPINTSGNALATLHSIGQ